MSTKNLKAADNCVNNDNKVPDGPSSQISLGEAKKNFLDITALIRSIQRAEGGPDCFRSAVTDCDQVDCKWRHICLEGQYGSKKS